MRSSQHDGLQCGVPLAREDLKALKKRANRLYDGNVSAVIAELAADARLLEGMNDLVSWMGGPSLTDDDRTTIEKEVEECRVKNGLTFDTGALIALERRGHRARQIVERATEQQLRITVPSESRFRLVHAALAPHALFGKRRSQ